MRTKNNTKQLLLENTNKEEFISFLNTHKIAETQEHFKISYNQIHFLMNNYDIKRDPNISNSFRFKNQRNNFQKLLEKLPKEKVIKDYIKGNYELKYLIDLYKIKSNQLYKLSNFYNLKGYKPQTNKIIRNSFNKNLHTTTIENMNRINKEEFQNYWNSHNKKEVAKYFNISLSNVNVYIRHCNLSKSSFNINKTRENTVLKNIGVSHALKKEEYKNKRKISLFNKYGDENFNNVKKREKTNVERYGVATYSTLKECKEKIKNTNLKKFGVEYLGQKTQDNYCEEYKELYHSREKSIEFLKKHPLTARQLCLLFNCPLSSIYYWSEQNNLSSYIKNEKSHYEEEIINYLKSLGVSNIEHNNRKLLENNQEIDIYLPDYKIGIEFNGDYWHSNLFLDKNYHFEKSKLAESKGIRLIHIYEHEWIDEKQQRKIKNMLLIATHNIKEKIFARKCEIREITNKEAAILNDEVHLQGHRNAKITYGLFYENKLVQLMSFSHNHKYGWEIIRGCPGSNNIVVGGVGKLFKHFIKTYSPSSVFSYCDFNKFDGISYEKIGMKFIGYTGPNKKYIIEGEVYNRNPNKYKEYRDKAGAIIWGAGSKKYLYEKEQN